MTEENVTKSTTQEPLDQKEYFAKLAEDFRTKLKRYQDKDAEYLKFKPAGHYWRKVTGRKNIAKYEALGYTKVMDPRDPSKPLIPEGGNLHETYFMAIPEDQKKARDFVRMQENQQRYKQQGKDMVKQVYDPSNAPVFF